jgi:hypothetical protein
MDFGRSFFIRLLAKVIKLTLLSAASPPPRMAAGALMQEVYYKISMSPIEAKSPQNDYRLPHNYLNFVMEFRPTDLGEKFSHL